MNDWVVRRRRHSGSDGNYAEKPDGGARQRSGKHARIPRGGKHATPELTAAAPAEHPAAVYAARHAVVDWVDLSAQPTA